MCLTHWDSIGTHWITLYVNGNDIMYFDSFGVENVPKEINKIIGNIIMITNIYRIQACDSRMRGYFRIGFINFCKKVKVWLIIQICIFLVIMRKRIKQY